MSSFPGNVWRWPISSVNDVLWMVRQGHPYGSSQAAYPSSCATTKRHASDYFQPPPAWKCTRENTTNHSFPCRSPPEINIQTARKAVNLSVAVASLCLGVEMPILSGVDLPARRTQRCGQSQRSAMALGRLTPSQHDRRLPGSPASTTRWTSSAWGCWACRRWYSAPAPSGPGRPCSAVPNHTAAGVGVADQIYFCGPYSPRACF
jgi:hypothetical protein